MLDQGEGDQSEGIRERRGVWTEGDWRSREGRESGGMGNGVTEGKGVGGLVRKAKGRAVVGGRRRNRRRGCDCLEEEEATPGTVWLEMEMVEGICFFFVRNSVF